MECHNAFANVFQMASFGSLPEVHSRVVLGALRTRPETMQPDMLLKSLLYLLQFDSKKTALSLCLNFQSILERNRVQNDDDEISRLDRPDGSCFPHRPLYLGQKNVFSQLICEKPKLKRDNSASISFPKH